MGTLYEIVGAMRDIIAMIDECEDDEQLAELTDRLQEIGGSLTEKAENYARVIRNFQAEADALKTEERRLKMKRERREKTVERLKQMLCSGMTLAGVKKIETPIGSWSRRTSPWSVNVIDEDAIPDEFKIPQPSKIDKAAILAEFKETGGFPPGVEMKQGESVSFR